MQVSAAPFIAVVLAARQGSSHHRAAFVCFQTRALGCRPFVAYRNTKITYRNTKRWYGVVTAAQLSNSDHIKAKFIYKILTRATVEVRGHQSRRTLRNSPVSLRVRFVLSRSVGPPHGGVMWGGLRRPKGPVQVTCVLAAMVLTAAFSIQPAYAHSSCRFESSGEECTGRPAGPESLTAQQWLRTAPGRCGLRCKWRR